MAEKWDFFDVNRMKKNILLIVLSALPFCPAQGGIYAVLVGISKYEKPGNNLSYCHRDAIEMYETLKAHTPSDRMILLTDAQAKHDNIVSYTKRLFQQAQPDDMVIFFFSGHGNSNIFMTYDKNLNFNTLKSIFKQTKAKRKLIFANACSSGTLRQPSRQTSSGNVNPGNNVLLFLSSRSNQDSFEDLSLRSGIFTYYLLAGLKGKADLNKDGYITAKELFDFVNPKVTESTKGKQVPVMWGKFNERMIILKLKDT